MKNVPNYLVGNDYRHGRVEPAVKPTFCFRVSGVGSMEHLLVFGGGV